MGACLCLNANAQRVTYNDLTFLLNCSPGDAIDYLMSKGFYYAGSDTTITEPLYVKINFSKNKGDDMSFMGVTKRALNGVFYEVSFFTAYKSDYLKFKEYLKKMGFDKTETTSHDSTVTESYLNLKHFKRYIQCDIDIGHDTGHDYNYYYITVQNIKKRFLAESIKDYMYNQ